MIISAIALLLVAMALMSAELFLPSHGVLSIFAALSAVASVYFAYRHSPALGAVFGIGMILATPFVIYWSIKLYPTTRVGKQVMLDPGAAATPAFTREQANLEVLVGQQGVAVSVLRPAGTIEVADRRVDALAESEIIPPGAPVEVIRVAGLKVFVKAVG